MSAFRTYTRFIKRYPIFSQAVQTGCLMATGDVVAQIAIERKSLKKVNFARTAQFASIGFFLTVSTKINICSGLRTYFLIKASSNSIH